VELWWQDEARIGQQGCLTYVWAEQGSRPSAPRDQRRRWAYLYGAVCPERGVGAGLVLPVANAEAMNLHLREISSQVTAGAHAVLILDGAGGTASPSLPPADRFAMASDRRQTRTARQHQLASPAARFAGIEPR
jgi:hypothetical protein